MLEIAALENGAHRNQTYHGILPEGWAVDRDGLCKENFPFGEVEAEEIDGVMTVTAWEPGEIPEPEFEPEEEEEEEGQTEDVWHEMAAAITEGVDSL